MQQVVVLANGKEVGLGEYVRGIQRAKNNPHHTYPHGLCGWHPVTGAEVVREFFAGVTERINKRGGLSTRADRKGSSTRLLEHVRESGRVCRWCGARFFPGALSETCCSRECYRSYH